MQEKRIHTGCLVQVENSVTLDNRSASLGKPRGAEVTLLTEFSIPTEQPFKILIIKTLSEKKKDMTKPTCDCAPREDSDQPGHPPSLISLCLCLMAS